MLSCENGTGNTDIRGPHQWTETVLRLEMASHRVAAGIIPSVWAPDRAVVVSRQQGNICLASIAAEQCRE